MELVLVEYELYVVCYYLVIIHVEDFTQAFVYAIKKTDRFQNLQRIAKSFKRRSRISL